MPKINNEFYAPLDYKAKVPKARHNLSTKRSFSAHIGMAIPVYFRRMYIGDEFYINEKSLLQTILPLNGPLLDCFELRFEYYFEPLSNLYGYIDNNTKKGVQDIINQPKNTVDLFGNVLHTFMPQDILDPLSQYHTGLLSPQYSLTRPNYPVSDFTDSYFDYEDCIKEGSLFELMGLPQFYHRVITLNGYEEETFTVPETHGFGCDFNIDPILTYLDIIRCYHINSQVVDTPYIRDLGDYVSTTNGIDSIYRYITIQKLDDLFTDLRYLTNKNNALSVNRSMLFDSSSNFGWFARYLKDCTNFYSGYFPVQYRPDMWRNLLSHLTGQYKALVQAEANGTITVEEIRQKNHLQRFIDALELSGGRYSQIGKTVFGEDADVTLKIPRLLGVHKHLIDPSNITALADSGNMDVGQMQAKVDKFNQAKPIRVKAHVDGYLMVIASITPLIGYTQGFVPEITKTMMADDFNPNLQRVGFENIPRGYYSVYPDQLLRSTETENVVVVTGDSSNNLDYSLGKQIKYIDEMTDVNRSFGRFANPINVDISRWVLTRDYTKVFNQVSESTLLSTHFLLSPYVNPLEYNEIFSMQDLKEPPFSLHVSFGISAKRPILKRYRPTIE